MKNVALALGALALCASGAHASESSWFGVVGSGGVLVPDPDLADFRRDVRPSSAWGLEARTGRGPWALGLRALTGSSAQDLGPIGAGGTNVAVDARTSRYELVARRHVTSFAGQALSFAASGGRARVAFDPGTVAVDDGAGGAIPVELAPVTNWTWGVGLALERALAPAWSAGLEADVATSRMDTAHRAGDAIVLESRSFTDVGVRVTLGWNTARRGSSR